MSKNKSLIAILMLVAMLLTFAACATTVVPNEETPDKSVAKAMLEELDYSADFSELLKNNSQLESMGLIAPTDKVKVIVSVEGTPLVDYYFDKEMTASFTEFSFTEEYRQLDTALLESQTSVVNEIAAQGIAIEYKHSYTELLNGFSAEVMYGDIAQIKKLPFVKDVVLSIEYNALSAEQSAASFEALMQETGILANDTDYQGDGMFIAVMDTGFELKHPVFAQEPEVLGRSMADIEAILESIYGATTTDLYLGWMNKTRPYKIDEIWYSAKVPFKFDYARIDNDPTIGSSTVNNYGGYHGQHVAGIIAGNDDTITGVVPNAQLALMKIQEDFESGIYLDDIVAALSDCVLLNVDAANLSLGAPCGFSYERDASMAFINEMYDKVEALGILLGVAAGNDGNMSYAYASGFVPSSNVENGLMSNPASYDAAFAVASTNTTNSYYFDINGNKVFYNVAVDNIDNMEFDFFGSLLGEGQTSKTLELVLIGGNGEAKDYEGLDVNGKAVLVQRGVISFEEKHRIAAENGAAVCIIYNNVAGLISAQFESTSWRIPTVTVSSIDSELLIAAIKAGNVEITFSVENKAQLVSAFSTWGPNPDLTIKPDIAAPGENIYSSTPSTYKGGSYAYLSGTSMATPNLVGAMAAVKQYLTEMYPECTNREIRNMVYQVIQSTADQVLDNGGNTASVRAQGAGIVNINEALATKAYLTVTGSDRTKLELGADVNKDGIYTLRFNVVNMSNEELRYAVSAETFTDSVYPGTDYVAFRSYVLNNGTVEVSGKTVEDGIVTVPANATVAVKVVITLTEEEKAYLDETFENGYYVEGFAHLESLDEGVDLSIPYLSFYGDFYAAPIFDASYYGEEEALIGGNVLVGYNGDYNAYIYMGDYIFVLPSGWEKPAVTEDNIALSLDASGTSYIYTAYMFPFRNLSYVEYNLIHEESGAVYYSTLHANVEKAYYNMSAGAIVAAAHQLDIDPSLLDTLGNQRLLFTIDAYAEDEKHCEHLEFPIFIDFEKPEVVSTSVREENGKTYVDVEVWDNHSILGYIPGTANGNTFESIGNYAYPVYDWVQGQNNTFTIDVTPFKKNLIDGVFCIQLMDYAMNTKAFIVADVDEQAGENSANVDYYGGLTVEEYVKAEERLGEYNAETYEADLAAAIAEEIASRQASEIVYSKAGEKVYVTADSEHKFTVNGSGVLTKYEGPGGDVVIPDDIGVKTIGASKDVFQYRTTLTSVTLPSTCTKIDNYGFRNSSVQYVHCPDTFTTLGTYAFYYCQSMKEFKVPAGVTALPTYVFRYSSIESIEIHDKVKSVGNYAFANCPYLKEINYPDSVTTFGTNLHLRNYGLTKVRLPKDITKLTSSMFSLCTHIEEFNFDELKKVTTWTGISWTLPLKEIIIHDPGVPVTIASGTFTILRGLERLVVYADIKGGISGAFTDMQNCKEIIFYGDIKGGIKSQTLSGSLSVEKIEFHGDIDTLGGASYPLTTMPKLKTVEFFGNVGNFGEYAFCDCPELEEVIFHKSVGIRSGRAFADSKKLTHYTVAEDNEYLVYDAETGITYNKERTQMHVPAHWDYDGELILPEGMETLQPFGVSSKYTWNVTFDITLEDMNFEGFAVVRVNIDYPRERITVDKPLLDKIVLPKGFTGDIPAEFADGFCNAEIDLNGAQPKNIGVGAFMNSGIENLVVPTSVETIEQNAFAKCPKLETISFEENSKLSYINWYAFEYCPVLESFDMTNVTEATLDKYVFTSCTALKSVKLCGIEYVAWEVFDGCTSLEEVVFGEGIIEIYEYSFRNTAIKELHLPASVTYLDLKAFDGVNSIEVITVAEGNKVYSDENNALLDIAGGLLYFYAVGSEDDTFVMPEGVTHVNDYAFTNARYLRNIVLADSLKWVGVRAFSNLTLDTITFKNNTYPLNYGHAFYNTTINKVIIEEDSVNYKMEGDFLMSKDGKVIYDYFGTEENAVIVIPEGVTYVGSYAFVNATNVKEVVLPATLKVIGAKAFYGCTSLEKITFKSEKAPLLEIEYDTERSLCYSNFICNIEDVAEGGLGIEFIAPDHASYRTKIYKMYFGL